MTHAQRHALEGAALAALTLTASIAFAVLHLTPLAQLWAFLAGFYTAEAVHRLLRCP